MKRVFYIVGATAVGKSELAAEVAQQIGSDVVSADAFQIYRGLDLLTAKPDSETRAKARHHLIGIIPLSEEMNVEKYRAAADAIFQHGKPVIVVGGTGLYVKALTHGVAKLPSAHQELREKLDRATTEELSRSLRALDPFGAEKIDAQNRRRLIRAVEVCLLTGKPFSEKRTEWNATVPANGILLDRDRTELYARINQRVEEMFAAGVVDEVRAAKNIGPTAEKTLGLREIQVLIAGEISQAECISKIQQATRRYAKRQLTWFRRQTNFPSLNLSAHDPAEAVELISQSASRVFARG
ncbi:MAG TPA: tRNA (adenosine(37)-N6)-dimethylallyltransferase MiaA [Chthoniobacterales bacterium]|jgi:tRNA dimethylallyltransferase|nr:tRNA (adenosine(37)-N6)-dimethylallyltransferase MiaA [Chthoniobacterales bacterium]